MAESSLPAIPRPETTTPLFPREQRRPSDRPAAVQGAKRTLDSEDRSGIIQREEREELRAGSPQPMVAEGTLYNDPLPDVFSRA